MLAPDQGRGVSAYYAASVAEFLATAPETVIGVLAMADMHGALDAEQRRAWADEIDIRPAIWRAAGPTARAAARWQTRGGPPGVSFVP